MSPVFTTSLPVALVSFSFLFLCIFPLSAFSRSHQLPFDPLKHSGAAAPYFDAPSQYGIDPATPAQCVVDQAAYIARHGARYPEPGSFAGWQTLFQKIQNTTFNASGPLTFLPGWVPAVDDQENEPLFLSATGAAESFDLGVKLRKAYGFTPGGGNITVWTAGQQRVVDTATWFVHGYLSQGNFIANGSTVNRAHVVTMPDSVNFTFANSLTPSNGCPPFSTGDQSSKANVFRASYQARIANRLNQFLDGLVLDPSDIGIMQDLCGFQTEINGNSEFCDVFKRDEWEDYEYADDLNYYWGSGPGNPFSAPVGYPYVKAITDLLVAGPGVALPNSTFTPPPLIMSFTHDNDMPLMVSALGIWNSSHFPGVYPLSDTTPNSLRTFRSSFLVSFRGYLAIERLSCDEEEAVGVVQHQAGKLNGRPGTSPDAKKFVRIKISDAPVPIPGCISGPGSTCPLADFATYIYENRSAVAGDFIGSCGLGNVSNATGVLDIYTNVPSKGAQSRVLQVPIPYALDNFTPS